MSKYSKGVSIETLYRRMVAETLQSHGYGCRKGESVATWQRRLRRKLLELLAIDASGEGLAHLHVVERWLGGVEPIEVGAQPRSDIELLRQHRIGLDPVHVGQGHIGTVQFTVLVHGKGG